ncbi:hypothetical protein NE236_41625 [Actinoallomurus purpureus]|uniref:hypothetical protein n=1 Tax=Actinoallomurus purpureus TaxID=478114 RepID=UPI0020925F75|nr:hypothetical protein [Actinoallomurus purpureus]MCO6011470.1 hypothetical protein [Actinoallomurus purpureus]
MDAFMLARRAMFRTGTRLPQTTTVEQEPTQPDGDPPLMRFLTVGGAVVELRSKRFKTRWHPAKGRPDAVVELRSKRFKTRWHPAKGRPDAVVEPYEVDGFAWECLGCDASGRDSRSYAGDYLPRERDEARDDANDHASACRAMPKPTTA